MSVINDFIAYSYVVDGDKKSGDRVYSIVNRFHRNESQTQLFQNKVKDNVDKGQRVIKKAVAHLDQYNETKKKI